MKASVIAALVCMAPVCAGAQSGAPIKIVGSLDLSGGAAVPGNDTLLGVQFAVETLNKKGGVLGRPVTFDYQDNGTNPQRAINQATALLQGGAVMLMAPQSSANTLAVTKTVSAKMKMPMCVSTSGSDAVTMKDFQPYVFSVTSNSWFDMKADAVKLSRQPYKRYAILAADYAGARASVVRFKEFLKAAKPDVEFVIEEYPKLGAIDYTASINKILAAKPDYVRSILYGNDLITFSKQAATVGFFQEINNRFAALYDESTLKALGDTAAVGSEGEQRAPAVYIEKLNPASHDYVTAYKAKHGTLPADWTTMAYDCVMVWAQAVAIAKTTDADPVMQAIETAEFQTNRGPLRFGKYDHQANVPVFMGTVSYSKELKQPYMEITDVIRGDEVRPTEAEVMKSRAE